MLTWIAMLALAGALAAVPAPPVPEIPLYDEPPKGWERATQVEVSEASADGPHVVRNVTRPTLTVVLPDAGRATGAGVLVIPGGGFFALAFDDQGLEVARWLASQGLTAFVLKYRVEATPPDRKALAARMQALMGALAADPDGVLPGEATAEDDARAAFALLLRRAAEFGVDPHRVGVLGFSAGAFMAIDLATAPTARPAFVGDLYAPVRRSVRVPPGAPPMFSAFAADDPLFGQATTQSFARWRQAHAPVELHVYETGGHGFGMRAQGAASDGWMDDFRLWLAAHGWTRNP